MSTPTAYYAIAVRDLVAAAELDGLVITIERRPLMPLAMGNAVSVIDIRPKREMAAPKEATA